MAPHDDTHDDTVYINRYIMPTIIVEYFVFLGGEKQCEYLDNYQKLLMVFTHLLMVFTQLLMVFTHLLMVFTHLQQ